MTWRHQTTTNDREPRLGRGRELGRSDEIRVKNDAGRAAEDIRAKWRLGRCRERFEQAKRFRKRAARNSDLVTARKAICAMTINPRSSSRSFRSEMTGAGTAAGTSPFRHEARNADGRLDRPPTLRLQINVDEQIAREERRLHSLNFSAHGAAA